MKPALTYYGGKQIMLPHILPLIPDHRCYVEPFCGGAAVFFAKKKSSVEILNDNDDRLINFYRILKHKRKSKKLFKMCEESLYSRSIHRKANNLFKIGSDIEKAWAFWYKITVGFSGKLDGGFSTTNTMHSSPGIKFTNTKNRLRHIAKRLEHIQVEAIDAISCIQKYDSEHVFFYLDPPYLNADQGHYKGYDGNDFVELLSLLRKIKGKFLLSCYPRAIIEITQLANNWKWTTIKDRIRAANKSQSPDCKKQKIEMLVWNYNLSPSYQHELFKE